MRLPVLKINIAVPDYGTTCEFCGYHAGILADFWHTNYRGAIYECTFCDKTTGYLLTERMTIQPRVLGDEPEKQRYLHAHDG